MGAGLVGVGSKYWVKFLCSGLTLEMGPTASNVTSQDAALSMPL